MDSGDSRPATEAEQKQWERELRRAVEALEKGRWRPSRAEGLAWVQLPPLLRALLDRILEEERVAAYGGARALRTEADCAQFRGRLDALDSFAEALMSLDNLAKELKDAQIVDESDD